MPLLQSIVEQFDRELARLHALRAIVAGLSRTSETVARFVSSPASLKGQIVLAAPAAPQAEEKPGPPRDLRAHRGKLREQRADKSRNFEQARAFAATIPSGPVVISPKRLAEEKVQRGQSREAQATVTPMQETEDLDALSQSLAARWSTGMAQ